MRNPAIEERAQARLAACWATEVAASAGRLAYAAAVSDRPRNAGGANRLQRSFRDLEVAATHKHVDHNVMIDSRSVLLGVNVSTVEI